MSLISQSQVDQFHELGYFLTDPAFPAAQVQAMSDEFDRLHNLAVAQAEKSGDETAIKFARLRPFIGQVHTKSDIAKAFIRSPIYLQACAKFLGPDADLYYNQAVIKPPEKGMSFAWHQDSGYRVTRPLEYITCWTAISDTTLDNGCIWVLPKSHKLGLIPHYRDTASSETKPVTIDESGAIPVPMKAGQVAIFSSFTLHKSGPNTSQTIRKGYVPQYHLPGVVAADTGVPFGDQFPVLRNNQPV
jgi:phytanoyl-CoA hydroxylase